MATEQYIKLGRQVALISFLLGTVIFGLYFMTSSFELLFVGYGFIALTGLINIVILILILFYLKLTRTKTTEKNYLRPVDLCCLTFL
ncbi:MAG: hypothetical protein IPN94_21945 [Sphingobacteriales bacterium]|nr:hypothetical protein [Sphingobacteriales bacterium]